MDNALIEKALSFIRSQYPGVSPVPLHAPRFLGNEKAYLEECIDSTFVSYVGKFVTDFENQIKRLTGAAHAVAMVNGTAALQMALIAAGIKQGEAVITQNLAFVATAAAIVHVGAVPIFVDVDKSTLGMSPESLQAFLAESCDRREDGMYDRRGARRISAIVPMHTFGHPARIEEIVAVAEQYGIQVIEDSAESLGSSYAGMHTGRFGRAGVFSFNGNKPVTTGGGGMVVTDDEVLADRVRHLSTTAKRPHRWEFFHDEVGYNLRLPNVNAALGCAQMEYFDRILSDKRDLAGEYREFFGGIGVPFVVEPEGSVSNYWLNAIILENREARERFLEYANSQGVQTRPIWTLMTKLPPYAECPRGPTPNAEWLEDRIVNIPSGVRF